MLLPKTCIQQMYNGSYLISPAFMLAFFNVLLLTLICHLQHNKHRALSCQVLLHALLTIPTKISSLPYISNFCSLPCFLIHKALSGDKNKLFTPPLVCGHLLSSSLMDSSKSFFTGIELTPERRNPKSGF